MQTIARPTKLGGVRKRDFGGRAIRATSLPGHSRAVNSSSPRPPCAADTGSSCVAEMAANRGS